VTRPRQVYGPNPPGRLPAAMLRALAAELSDPGRFARAKAYARDGAVIDIVVGPGEARGEILGSRDEPYVASLYVAPADDRDTLLGLIPDRDEVMATCTCPDEGPVSGAFCKHALATMLVLADEVTIDTAVLQQWRSGGGDAVGHHLAAPVTQQPPIDVLATLLATPAPLPDLPDLPPRLPMTLAPRHGQHSADVADVLADALAVLRSR
jgi:SWIM zinc finger